MINKSGASDDAKFVAFTRPDERIQSAEDVQQKLDRIADVKQAIDEDQQTQERLAAANLADLDIAIEAYSAAGVLSHA